MKTPQSAASRSTAYRSLLYFTAYRLLGDECEADQAVDRCLFAISRSAPSFDNEGAFRSWLIRLLIDEALLVLHDRAGYHHPRIRMTSRTTPDIGIREVA